MITVIVTKVITQFSVSLKFTQKAKIMEFGDVRNSCVGITQSWRNTSGSMGCTMLVFNK